MEIYAKRFTKMALIYLALGVVMGMVIGSQPEWSQRLRLRSYPSQSSGFHDHVYRRSSVPCASSLQRPTRSLARRR